MSAPAEQRRSLVPTGAPAVLSFGYDMKLLLSRERVFAQAGFEVDSSASLEQALEFVDDRCHHALVVGHRVPEEQRSLLAARFRQKNPHGRIVFLYLGSIHNTEAADAVLSISSSATDLAIAISHQVRRAGPG